MGTLEPLLLNVLFLIVFLLFIPLILELNVNSFFNKNKTWIINLSAAIAIVCCISFPIYIKDGYLFDLRLIAITVVGLYGGGVSILFLALTTVLYRLLVGGTGAAATLIMVTLLSTILYFFTHSYRNGSRQKKIIIGTLISIGVAAGAVLNSTMFFDQTFSKGFLITYIMITAVSTVLIIYLKEFFQDSILLSKRIIKAEKMEVVSHLASSVSHEVRNPLTVIRGFLQMMMHKDISEDQRQIFLEISMREIDRANDIIRNYLTFAKPSPENIKAMNIRDEVHRTLQIIMPLANMNGVKVETKLEDYFIKGEEQVFQQCLVNITKNCIEAMPNSGILSIVASKKCNHLIIVISDNGKGMTKEQLSRLGEPYFTTKGREGTGLGMMAAIKIIETMSGKLTVRSEVNEGTTFTIQLPLEASTNENEALL